MNLPAISIIIPIYNAESTLRKCLDSVLKQTYQNFEVLLINDGSTDNSRFICDEYAKLDNRFKVFHKNNGGVSSARNKGLEQAKGEWITFADADDWVYPTWIENFVKAMTPNCDMIVQGFRMKYETPKIPHYNEKIYGFNYNGNIKEAINKLYQDGSLGFIWVKLFKKNILKKTNIHFYEELTFTEDYYFIMEYLSAIQEVVCTKKIGYFYIKPNWNAKYSNAIFADMTLLNKLCNKALSQNNTFLFSFYIDNLIHGILDSYIKSIPNSRLNLKTLKNVIINYKKQNNITCKDKKFILFSYLLYFDTPSLLFTHLILKGFFNTKNFIIKKIKQ